MAKTEVVEHEALEEVVPTVDEQQSWGPFRKLTHITNQYGTFGVPRGKVLRMELRSYFNKKTRQTEERMMPVYTDVKISNEDTLPSVPLTGQTDEKNRENVRKSAENLAARKAKLQEKRIEETA